MTRIKRGNVARKRRKRILKFAKGFRGAHSKLFRTSKQQVMKALVYSYIGRKSRKREFRKLWICRINAAARINVLKYHELIYKLKKKNIGLNRKILAQIAVLDPLGFEQLIRCINQA